MFTLTFDSDTGRFRDDALREFLAGKQLLDVRDEFFTYHGQPYWAAMVFYPAVEVPGEEIVERKKNQEEKFKFRDQLDEAQQTVFNSLRDWRNEKAKVEGVPPYIISTNEQLAQMVIKDPKTLEELSQVQGFGDSRIERHGKEILAILHSPSSKAEGKEISDANDGSAIG